MLSMTTLCVILLAVPRFGGAQNLPKIFTKGGNVHIRSGDNGNIVFEPSQQGKVIVGSHELNVSSSVGPKGEKGDVGATGVKGERGPPGPEGQKDVGETSYYTNGHRIKCNSSNFGVLRYFSTKLQLCTPKGWRYLAFSKGEVPPCSFPNVPEANIEAFYAADPGLMFQFNKEFTGLVNPPNSYNITTDLLPFNSTLSYENGVMRHAVHFSGKAYLNVSGIPEDFWRTRNWSVMALMNFGDVKPSEHFKEISVVGHGNPSAHNGLHLGIRDQKVIFGYFSNDLLYPGGSDKLTLNTWYHITWTSEKIFNTSEERCIIINGDSHNCRQNTIPYKGIGDTTIGNWWHRSGENNLVLDQLIIASGLVHYRNSGNDDKQLCYAKVVDMNLP